MSINMNLINNNKNMGIKRKIFPNLNQAQIKETGNKLIILHDRVLSQEGTQGSGKRPIIKLDRQDSKFSIGTESN
jgi:hypothetical protein